MNLKYKLRGQGNWTGDLSHSSCKQPGLDPRGIWRRNIPSTRTGPYVQRPLVRTDPGDNLDSKAERPTLSADPKQAGNTFTVHSQEDLNIANFRYLKVNTKTRNRGHAPEIYIGESPGTGNLSSGSQQALPRFFVVFLLLVAFIWLWIYSLVISFCSFSFFCGIFFFCAASSS